MSRHVNSFTIFAHGEQFDVDAYLSSPALRPNKVWRRGDSKSVGCEELHPTSGIEFILGDGISIPFLKQERIAIAFLDANRNELKDLGGRPGVETFILGLQYRASFDSSVLGFGFGPSTQLMRRCLDIGIEPYYYVELERLQDDSDNED
jgi:hypothetical protein